MKNLFARFNTDLLRLPVLMLVWNSVASGQNAIYLEEIKKTAEKGWQEYPGIIERWKQTTMPNVLWGYDSPGHPLYLACTFAYLFEQTGEKEHARKAAELISTYGSLRSVLPKGYDTSRAEYMSGVPAIANFFYMPPYIRTYLRIRNAGVIDAKTKGVIERDLAGSADFIFHFPEWGAHNRAMLRAEALIYAALALPDHKNAGKWRQMAAIIAEDNLRQWEIEDATVYHPVWLLSLYSYAEAANRLDLFDSPLTKYYLEYYKKLIGPNGTVPEFGDARWNSGWEGLRLVPVFEKGAAVFRDPELKWAAKTIFESAKKHSSVLGVVDAYSLSDAIRWGDETIVSRRPVSLSQEVLEDVVGKKIVFRNGWEDQSTYLLLTYRDEGDGGWLHREFLRRTISVEEEKMHHGHADENSIPLLMSKGSVLLHDADYRSDLPSGKFGAWRQDYFHNRIVARLNKRDANQSVLEFVQNSGAYRPVVTRKIDFLNLREVDMSRTRLIDNVLGYQWDRIITYVKEEDLFVVVDGIKVLRSDFFTFTNFWHGRHILSKGPDYFDIATDSIQRFQFATNRSLFVYFPETYAKTIGSETISRSHQQEQAVYQTQSSHYNAGDTEVFVTVLIPHDRKASIASLKEKIKLTSVSKPYLAVGLEIRREGKTSVLGVKIDLDMDLARENIRPRYLYDLGKVRYGDYETDADYFFATTKNKQVEYSASNVLKVIYKGKPLMEALPNTHGLQLDGAPPRVGFVKWRYWEDTVPRP
ncbi:MAG: heparinase II/III family protein [Bacteroidota bacterium]